MLEEPGGCNEGAACLPMVKGKGSMNWKICFLHHVQTPEPTEALHIPRGLLDLLDITSTEVDKWLASGHRAKVSMPSSCVKPA